MAQGPEETTTPSSDEAVWKLKEGSMNNQCLQIFLQTVETGVQEYIKNFGNNAIGTPTQPLPNRNVYIIQDQINQEIQAVKRIAGMA